MSDLQKQIDELMIFSAQQEGKILALKLALSTLLSRCAREYDDPEQYIISLLAPMQEIGDEHDPADKAGTASAQATFEFAHEMEETALYLTQD